MIQWPSGVTPVRRQASTPVTMAAASVLTITRTPITT